MSIHYSVNSCNSSALQPQILSDPAALSAIAKLYSNMPVARGRRPNSKPLDVESAKRFAGDARRGKLAVQTVMESLRAATDVRVQKILEQALTYIHNNSKKIALLRAERVQTRRERKLRKAQAAVMPLKPTADPSLQQDAAIQNSGMGLPTNASEIEGSQLSPLLLLAIVAESHDAK